MITQAQSFHWRRQAGLTLSEMMVTFAIFGMAVVGLISCQLFGMRQDQLVNSKIGASEQARRSFNLLADDVRAAKIWQIGNGNGTSFIGIPEGQNQRGNALRLSLTTDTNKYYVYYFDTNAAKLFRFHKTSATEQCLAEHLTNTMFFQAQNYRGEDQSDPTHKGVVNVVMEFCQYQYPVTKIGPGCLYDYYRFGLRLTPHVPDGP
jgi:type II secretory pathway component PulJ